MKRITFDQLVEEGNQIQADLELRAPTHALHPIPVLNNVFTPSEPTV
jgi:hypothetical protein